MIEFINFLKSNQKIRLGGKKCLDKNELKKIYLKDDFDIKWKMIRENGYIKPITMGGQYWELNIK